MLTSTGNLSTAFNYQGFGTPECPNLCGNTVTAIGPGAIAGAINVVKQIVIQPGPGITSGPHSIPTPVAAPPYSGRGQEVHAHDVRGWEFQQVWQSAERVSDEERQAVQLLDQEAE